MGVEIEKKFLVHKNEWEKLERPEGEFFRQGYLLTDPNKTIRVRQTSAKGFITIKGKSVGATRVEFEYEIPWAEAAELLDQFSDSELSKVRYTINFDGNIWEIDEFLGENKGLTVAEIELKSEEEEFSLPPWIAKEVTGEEKYYNSNLTQLPFKMWK
ncbi:CYTH domain-containing protein [Chryseobacterium sp. MP_3.2]|uniref:CYTH domain-containing protein n=1 Tax=Chryseobacterium sp. MP_3.2 TaxID=3071712 RepID=UPI002E011AA7|nr:adenylate cyclase [Chryseobacterium sp. MP_3.2]